MADPNTFFKMTEGNGTTACTVLVRPAQDATAVTVLDFTTKDDGSYVASEFFAPNRYFIEWVMLSNDGGTIEIDISDDKGKAVRPPIKDTNKTGKPFKPNGNEFTIAAEKTP